MTQRPTEPPQAPAQPRRLRPLAKIRHDLRTPIHHILGFSEILLEETGDAVPANFLRDLQKIHAGGHRLLGLIEQHLSKEAFPVEKPDIHHLCHELRTPVNHIIGYSELLSEQCADLGRSDFQADLQKIQAAAKTWLSLMEQELIGDTDRDGPTLKAGHTETEQFCAMAQSLSSESSQELPSSSAQIGRLLVADDDPSNRELLCRRLEKLGHQVTAVADGEAALKALREEPFDLVLLDLLMPGLDGREVLARIKADSKLREVPVVMISALDHVDGIVRCIELGAEDYVPKPFNQVFLRARVGAGVEKKRLREREMIYLRQIQEEKKRSDELLHIILPQDVAAELKATDRVKPRRFEDVGVLFCDIVEFTRYCDQHPPEEVVEHLQHVVEAFEEISHRHGIEKIKTIGDAFMGAIGLGTPPVNAALSCVSCGLEMADAARRLPPHWEVRVGVHVGPAIAGIVGRRKYQYDVWGDTVNLAARLAAAGKPGCVCLSADTWRRLGGHPQSKPIGCIELKGKGPVDLFLIGD